VNFVSETTCKAVLSTSYFEDPASPCVRPCWPNLPHHYRTGANIMHNDYGDDTGAKQKFVHARIFGWQSVKASTVYALVVLSLVAGIILGGSPLFRGVLFSSDEAASAMVAAGGRIDFDNVRRWRNMPHTLDIHSHAQQPQQQVQQQRPRLLFMTASYTMDQLKAFQQTMDCMRDICNAGWNVTVHVQSASDLTYEHERYKEFQSRLWCEDSHSYVPLIIEHYDKIGFGLNSKHRHFIQGHVHDFDYFSFAEEDMLLTISHLKAFINFQARLKLHLPKTHLRYTIGFLRYEDSTIDTERVSWEYLPAVTHVIDMGEKLGHYIATNNLNQAIYLFSQEQIVDLEERCHFITEPGQNAFYREMRKAMDRDWKYMAAGVSEWSSSFQQVLQCGMRRIIPAAHYETFMIHHAVDKAQSRRPRGELLNAREFHEIIRDKIDNNKVVSIEDAYNTHVYNQYNLGLMDTTKFAGKSMWSWGVDKEEPV